MTLLGQRLKNQITNAPNNWRAMKNRATAVNIRDSAHGIHVHIGTPMLRAKKVTFLRQ